MLNVAVLFRQLLWSKQTSAGQLFYLTAVTFGTLCYTNKIRQQPDDSVLNSDVFVCMTI